MSTTTPVIAISASGRASVYSSIRAASRVLSGNGTDSLKDTIARRVSTGGGYVGNVYVTDGTFYRLEA